jgi:hypothetical protein
VASRRVDLPDEDPLVPEDEKPDGTREPAVDRAIKDDDTDEASARDEGASIIENRIEDVKQKAREMGEGERS